ncbi:hypothetical protein MTO96_031654 [Rhipicephalus appendiculatus]
MLARNYYLTRLSDICRVDGAFKLLSSTDPEVRERAREELDRVVSEWRFIHRARLNLLPLYGTRTWVPAADKRSARGGDTAARPLPLHAAEPGHDGAPQRHRRAPQEGGPGAVRCHWREPAGRRALACGPDLVLARGEEALVLDICCPFRQQDAGVSRRPGGSKRRSMPPLQLHLLQRFQRVSVDAIAVGCLSTWDPGNNHVCRRLCSKHYLRTMKKLGISDTIAASTTIYRSHIETSNDSVIRDPPAAACRLVGPAALDFLQLVVWLSYPTGSPTGSRMPKGELPYQVRRGQPGPADDRASCAISLTSTG